MIEQLARSIEMVVLKQVKLITGHTGKSSGLHNEPLMLGLKTEMWIGVIIDPRERQDKQFKITIEEIL